MSNETPHTHTNAIILEKCLLHEVSYSSHNFRRNRNPLTSFEKQVGVVAWYGVMWKFEVGPERKYIISMLLVKRRRIEFHREWFASLSHSFSHTAAQGSQFHNCSSRLNTSVSTDHFNSIIPGLVWLCSTSIIVLILINESALPSIKSVGFPRSRLTECQEALAVSQHLCHLVKVQSWVVHYFRSTEPPSVIEMELVMSFSIYKFYFMSEPIILCRYDL